MAVGVGGPAYRSIPRQLTVAVPGRVLIYSWIILLTLSDLGLSPVETEYKFHCPPKSAKVCLLAGKPPVHVP
jgi:hypothetical protein